MPNTPKPYVPPEQWVPLDRRWCGLDTASIAPAAVVLGLALTMSVAIPVIDFETRYHEEVQPGDIMAVATGVTFVPRQGWGITGGVRAGHQPVTGYPDSATVVDGDASFALSVVDFAGTVDDLLTQQQQQNVTDDADVGERSVVTTDQGMQGVQVDVSGTNADQLIAAFTVDDVGITVLAIVPPDAGPADHDAVAGMVASIRTAADPT